MIDTTRIQTVRIGTKQGKSVLYVMGRDQRIQNNHALFSAQQAALQHKLPLAVIFCAYKVTAPRAREHYSFMFEGLREIEQTLETLDIPLIVVFGAPKQTLKNVFAAYEPESVYFDFSPLRGPRKLVQELANEASYAVAVVDTHNLVPVTIATQKQEVGARTLRPKILRVLGRYIEDTVQVQKHPIGWPGTFKKMAELTTQISDVLDSLNSNQTHILVESGESAARRALDDFIAYRLPGYAQNRNDPSQNGTSGLSPYLHFGQLWSGEVVQKAYQALQSNPLLQPDVDALVEELVVRKELSENFCYYQPRYDEIAGAPLWAQNTLLKHQTDLRSYLYSLEEFEQAKTHDPAWNAAQTQLTKTGCMHGYMRMYWAKKVLEWSESPKRALVTLTYLNDFYSLDGGDPNGYTGILWSIAGLHDRPWGERAIYGTVRCMVYDGLRRKFAIEEYIQAWQ